MNLILGLVLTGGVLFYSMGSGSLSLFFQPHSLVLVFGGTLAIYVLSNKYQTIKNLVSNLINIFKTNNDFKATKDQLLNLAKNKNFKLNTENELVLYAQSLWQSGVTQELFIVLLSQHKKEIEHKSVDAIQSLKNLAKYPASLGMIGTVIGMIGLFKNLDHNKNGIGSSLSLAMTATFLGLVLANMILMPLADRLQLKHIIEKNELNHIYQILLLINQNEAIELIQDEVNLRVA